jgi:hypothetical protein
MPAEPKELESMSGAMSPHLRQPEAETVHFPRERAPAFRTPVDTGSMERKKRKNGF